jgi:hypothetical protein
MHELVTGAAQYRQPTSQFSFVESAANLAFSVPGSRDQVMPGQFRIRPLAEFTSICLHLIHQTFAALQTEQNLWEGRIRPIRKGFVC